MREKISFALKLVGLICFLTGVWTSPHERKLLSLLISVWTGSPVQK